MARLLRDGMLWLMALACVALLALPLLALPPPRFIALPVWLHMRLPLLVLPALWRTMLLRADAAAVLALALGFLIAPGLWRGGLVRLLLLLAIGGLLGAALAGLARGAGGTPRLLLHAGFALPLTAGLFAARLGAITPAARRGAVSLGIGTLALLRLVLLPALLPAIPIAGLSAWGLSLLLSLLPAMPALASLPLALLGVLALAVSGG
jgi:ABC-type spermidine/putrescine transport system permease subunit II